MKTCVRCGSQERTTDGRRCRPCLGAYGKAWRANNIDRCRAVDAKKEQSPKYVQMRAQYRKAHKTQMTAYGENYWRRNRDAIRSKRLMREYGISLDDYREMLKSQAGLCAICKTDKAGGAGTFHVDHCHSTGHVRGLLCRACNTAVGLFRDDAEALIEAAAYLRRSRQCLSAA